jgi:4-amino-4-deoxy-L-arabinose transferase-like glycosyltransferase
MADLSSVEKQAYLEESTTRSLLKSRVNISARTLSWLIPLAVFVMALLPRVLGLGTFITADEDDQIMFASHFLNSMLNGNFGGALVLGYPGVPTLIFGAIGVGARYLAHYSGLYPIPWVTEDFFTTLEQTTARFGVFDHPLDFVVWLRVPMALVAALAILGVFLLTRKLLNQPVALVTAALLAFDPFILAHSRVVHVDAPMSYFMFLSFLAFMLYLDNGQWRWLILSGVFGGLAGLSKTPAAILGPILVLAGTLFALLPPPNLPRLLRWKRLVVALVVWGLIAVAAIFAMWPSMWSNPQFAIQWVIGNISSVSASEHPTSGVFWSPWQSDQNPYYYLLVFPFHLTPLGLLGVLVGLAMIGVGLVHWWREHESWPARVLPLMLGLLMYTVLFMIPVSAVARRGDRYILPVYFALALFAALALWWLAGLLAERLPRLFDRLRLSPARLTGGLLAVQVASVLVYHPYYLAYFNPVVGGPWIAPKTINIGWGEGLDRAASYLNASGRAKNAEVAAWYSNQFAPYYHGQTIDLSSEQAALTSDTTVFYINQVQRGFPSKEILNYFRQRDPEKVIELGGVEYAWIYPGPVIGQEPAMDFVFPMEAVLSGKARLYGVDVPVTEIPADRYAVAPGENEFDGPYLGYKETLNGLPVTLFWETLGPIDASDGKLNVFVRLVDEQGNVWGQVDRLILGGLWRANRWFPGYYLRDEYKLPIDPATPPGAYNFEVGLYDFETGQSYGVAKDIGQITLTPPAGLPKADRLRVDKILNQPAGEQLTVVGHTYADLQLPPGGEVAGKIYWQAASAIEQGHTLQFSFLGPDRKRYIVAENLPLAKGYPETDWRKSEIVGQAYRFPIPAVAPPGRYPLQVTVTDAATGRPLGEPVTLANITVETHRRNFELPTNVAPISAVVNSELELVGYRLDDRTVTQGDTFGLTLYWRSLEFAGSNYTVFVHAVGPDQTIRGQWDSVPAQGEAPTSGWVPGEIIEDHYQIPMTEDAPPWEYDIFVGMYDPVSGQRLPLFSPKAPTSNDRVWLTRVQGVEK